LVHCGSLLKKKKKGGPEVTAFGGEDRKGRWVQCNN